MDARRTVGIVAGVLALLLAGGAVWWWTAASEEVAEEAEEEASEVDPVVDPEDDVRRAATLAKVRGRPEGTPLGGDVDAGVELALDPEAAERLLHERSGVGRLSEVDATPPTEYGRYPALDELDLDRDGIVAWMGRESSTCPWYVVDVGLLGGHLAIQTEQVRDQLCIDDSAPYTILLAVDRDRLPADAEEAGDLAWWLGHDGPEIDLVMSP